MMKDILFQNRQKCRLKISHSAESVWKILCWNIFQVNDPIGGSIGRTHISSIYLHADECSNHFIANFFFFFFLRVPCSNGYSLSLTMFPPILSHSSTTDPEFDWTPINRGYTIHNVCVSLNRSLCYLIKSANPSASG